MMWRRLRRHKVGMFGLVVFLAILVPTLFAEFFAPYGINETTPYSYAPPQLPRFVDVEGKFHIRPFVYTREPSFDLATGTTEWTLDTSERRPLTLFARGAPYRFLFFRSNIHLFGVDGGDVFLLGTDSIGRDVLSRLIYGGRVSLAIAGLTALISLVVGTAVGMASGYFAGRTDTVIQRIVELFLIIPSIPLGLALAAFLPPDLAPLLLALGIAVVLSVVSWANVARQLRGKTLAIRGVEFVQASIAVGATDTRVLIRHVLPSMYSHLIVLASLIIPQAILAESGLSFLGFGIRPPMTSWGALLRDAQNFRVLALYPWLLVPGFTIMATVLALNFIGDGLRDAADPNTS